MSVLWTMACGNCECSLIICYMFSYSNLWSACKCILDWNYGEASEKVTESGINNRKNIHVEHYGSSLKLISIPSVCHLQALGNRYTWNIMHGRSLKLIFSRLYISHLQALENRYKGCRVFGTPGMNSIIMGWSCYHVWFPYICSMSPECFHQVFSRWHSGNL